MEAKNLYLPNSNYNIARILEALKKIIIDNGGSIEKYKYAEKTLIHNRSIAEELRKKEDHLLKVEANNNERFAEKKAAVIKNIKADLEELQNAAATTPRSWVM